TGVFATPAIAYGNAYVGSMDGYFHAIRLSDGGELWKQFTSLRTTNPRQENGISSSAAILGDTVYVGGDDASVWAFDVSTGAVLWSTVAIDQASNRLFAATGNACLEPDSLQAGAVTGQADMSQNLPWDNSVVALDLDTGATIWVYKYLSGNANNLDFGASPV